MLELSFVINILLSQGVIVSDDAWKEYYEAKLLYNIEGFNAQTMSTDFIKSGYVIHKNDFEKMFIVQAQFLSCQKQLIARQESVENCNCEKISNPIFGYFISGLLGVILGSTITIGIVEFIR